MLVSRLSELELPINNAIKKWHQNHFPPLRAGNTCSRHFEMRSHTLDFPLKTNHFQNNILLLFHKRLQGSSCSKCSPLVRIHLLKYVPTRGPPQHIQRYNDTHAHTCVYYIKKYEPTNIQVFILIQSYSARYWWGMLKMTPLWKGRGLFIEIERHDWNMYFIVLCMFFLLPLTLRGSSWDHKVLGPGSMSLGGSTAASMDEHLRAAAVAWPSEKPQRIKSASETQPLMQIPVRQPVTTPRFTYIPWISFIIMKVLHGVFFIAPRPEWQVTWTDFLPPPGHPGWGSASVWPTTWTAIPSTKTQID